MPRSLVNDDDMVDGIVVLERTGMSFKFVIVGGYIVKLFLEDF